ncbi:MAG: DUF2800 domain-containing protein [Synergistaceae bacterium]|nr:DUF2800 domain-containing protein [Synergistaceae bacterium]
MPDVHARFSPSAAEQYINCPPSLVLGEQFEDDNSEYAAEGTEAHALCEYLLRTELGECVDDPTPHLKRYDAEMRECAEGYADPMRAIAHIHERNRDRLDKFSTVLSLIKVEGNRSVEREMTVYNFKVFLEICRFSNQPNANAVIDFAWSVMDEIRCTGNIFDSSCLAIRCFRGREFHSRKGRN